MLFLSITRPELMQIAVGKDYAIELRLDLFPGIDIELVKKFLHHSPRPVMLTLRKTSQGGKFQGNETEREALIERLLSLEPHFFDLEYDMRPDFLHHALKKHPKTKFILSYHDFQGIPSDLDTIYHSMAKYPAFGFKIAAITPSTNDALRMLIFVKNHPRTSVICMGEKGAFARVLGPVAGNLIDYASLDAENQAGPGQLTVSELMDIYHYPSLNSQTAIYGLIGDPIAKSPGHLHHNGVFKKRHLNAVYVKMTLTPEELSDFIPLAKEIGIRGLSVTIPLKERIMPFLDEVDESGKQIGAVNTLLFKNGRISGTNTDGFGALDAIEKKVLVRGKNVVLLGAGGAARGIAFEALARGADVLILNRTVQKAKDLAAALNCRAGGLDDVPSKYDVIINCSPDPMPIDPKKILSKTLAMDVVYSPRETVFLKEAAQKGCQIVYGEEMFLNQAAGQTAFWLRNSNG